MVLISGVPSELALRTVWQAVTDAVAVSDRHGNVLAANPAYYALYGYQPDEVLGQSFAVIFPESERAGAEAQYLAVFEGPADQPPFETVVRRRDGTERIVQSRIMFVEEGGRRVAMVSVIRDVTAEVAARRAADAAEHSREELLSSLSHDIKSPVAVVKGQAQLLRRRVTREGSALSAEQLVTALSQIEASALRVSSLVDELVEVSGLTEGGAPPLNVALTDLVALAQAAVDRHQRLAADHRLAVRAEVDSAAGYWDAARIERVLDNLIGNAIKYSPRGGTVIVSVAPAERPGASAADAPAPGMLLTVEDTGMGINSADLPHVFERFRRGANVERAVPGSGIGLSSVREIVLQHGGEVGIVSQEGVGTTVSVWLPLEALPHTEDEPKDAGS